MTDSFNSVKHYSYVAINIHILLSICEYTYEESLYVYTKKKEREVEVKSYESCWNILGAKNAREMLLQRLIVLRTADVRSVGYSELFSLSREDVLAAMKDYPEAQEILQALGRKRLMEVKASARHPPHHKDHHHGHHHGQDGKGLVDKLKSEAKGLRNALKKTRTHRRSQESLELQPLHAPANNNKATLKRMSRVKSNELSQEENEKKENSASEPVVSPIGAGLPLLQRLKLLKEKQDNEERSKSATPPILSPTSSTMRSPPPISEDVGGELIGAGLPLLQRILMLKAKEEKASKASRTGVGGAKSVTSQLFSGISLNKGPSVSQTTSQLTNVTATRASFSGPSKNALTLVGAKGAVPVKLLNNKISLRDRIKLATSAKEKDTSIKDSLLKDSDPPSITDTTLKLVPFQPSSNNSNQIISSGGASASTTQTSVTPSVGASARLSDNNNLLLSKTSLDSIDSVDRNEPHWKKLKKAAISKDVSDTGSPIHPKEITDDGVPKEVRVEPVSKEPKPKPSLFLTRKTKHYRMKPIGKCVWDIKKSIVRAVKYIAKGRTPYPYKM
ncbi:hypothetical protein NQ315_013735 [Exocentrus adspersus]|uniref:Uncharacterized protein n=1 Tax=Exocentrus adspersus TaxID=1586481 RepID=A0AAV8W3M1_9CUCU|nr:hypothetical protein NQ315_013735 [Exocentrus adspersus]